MVVLLRSNTVKMAQSTVLGDEQIAALAAKCWQKQNQIIAVAVCLAESGGNEHASNYCCVGLWQINVLVHTQYTKKAMENGVANVTAACVIFHAAGGWQPWESYTNGSYKQYLPRAQKAVKEWARSGSGENVEGLTEPFGGPHSEGAAEATVNAAKSALSWTAELAKVLHFLGSSSGWLRVGKVALGGVLLLIALDELSKIGPGPSVNATGAAKKLAKGAALAA